MSNNKAAFKAGLGYTFANFLTRGMGMITTPIFTRLLTQSEYGIFSSFQSWVEIFSVLATLKVSSTLISARFDYGDRFDEYIYSITIFAFALASLWLVVIVMFYEWLKDILGLEVKYLICILVYVTFQSVVSMYQTREQYYYRYKNSVLVSLGVSLSSSFLSVLLVFALDNGLNGRIIGYTLPGIVVGFFLFLYIARKGKRLQVSYWKYAIVISLPYVPHLLSMSVLNSMDRIMITNLRSIDETAFYSVAYSCGSIITVLLSSMNTAFAPWLGEKLHEDSYGEIRQFSKNYIGCFVVLAYGIMLIAPEVLAILGGDTYVGAIFAIPPIMCGCAMQFLYTLFVNVEQFKKKTVGMAVASTLAAILNAALNALLIPAFGYVAAAYTTLVGYLALLMMHMYLVKRIGYSQVYDYAFVIRVVIMSLVVTVGVNMLYHSLPARYLVVAGYAVGCTVFVFHRKDQLRQLLGLKKGNS